MKITKSRKCCFCAPLKPALLLIGYMRLAICLITVGQFVLLSVDLFNRLQNSYEDAVMFIECVVSVVPQLLDMVFTLIFIFALHKGNINLQEVFYYYSITMSLIYFLIVILVSCNMERFKMMYYMIFQFTWFVDLGYIESIACGCLAIVLQIYMTYLVRCEVKNQRDRIRAELSRQRSKNSYNGVPKINVMLSYLNVLLMHLYIETNHQW